MADLVLLAKERGVSLNRADIDTATTAARNGELVLPPFVRSFISEIICRESPASVLELFSGTGALLEDVVRSCSPSEAVGVEVNAEAVTVARALTEDLDVDWIHGDPLAVGEQLNQTWDCIVSFPPLGLRRERASVPTEDSAVDIQDELGLVSVAAHSVNLGPNGLLALVTGPRFRSGSDRRSLRAVLGELNLHVRAFIEIPRSELGRDWGTSIAPLLVLIDRTPRTEAFVGELTADPSRAEVLLEGLYGEPGGSSPRTGVRVPVESFTSIERLERQRRIDDALDSSPHKLIRLSEMTDQMNLVRGKEGFEGLANAVYLPMIGNSEATTSPSDLTVKHHNCVELVLVPDLAISQYVASSLNSEIGHLLRESWKTGATIPKMSLRSLGAASLPLPDLKTQQRVIGLEAQLLNVRTSIEHEHRRLWSDPQALDKVEARVDAVSGEVDLSTWLDELPFPLASVLWAYYGQHVDLGQRFLHLIHFFEALAEFHATILLSAACRDSAYYEEMRERWLGDSRRFADSSFGAWVYVAQRIAASLRRLLDKQSEDREATLEWLGRPPDSMASMLVDRKIYSTLGEVVDLRNQWLGHSGAVNDDVYRQRISVLESHLSTLRSRIGDGWHGSLLAAPINNTFDGGVYRYAVYRLVGTRHPFVQAEVITTNALKQSRLHLVNTGGGSLELLPLLRLMESPRTSQNACYFYNRVLKGGSVRWVSYHYDQDAETTTPSSDISEALDVLGVRPSD
ncbi:MAG: hypothetical protein PF636_08070 [Actinomycetota bacterium]|nr:hypothetical protein [Actinomycetota bacterium]